MPKAGHPVEKQLIVVVHGVGIRAAGESSDLVAGALDGAREQGPADPFRRRSSDDFVLFETPEGSEARIAPTFPARLTRFRRFRGAFPEPDSPERVISDFYWGDVGGFAGSAPGLLVGLGRVMLGLAHVVRENALTVFPDLGNPRQRALRGLARGAALAIHGPIFALNITLFIGLLAVVVLGPATPWVSVVTGLLSLALALVLQRSGHSFLLRHMGAYLGAAGCLLLGFVLLDGLKGTPQALPVIDDMFREALCSWKEAGAEAECQTGHRSGAFLHSMRLQGLMVVLWCFVALTTLGFGLRWVLRSLAGKKESARDILMPTLGLMSLLWFLLIGLGWAAIAGVYGQIGPGPIGGLPEIPAECRAGPYPPGSPCALRLDHTRLFTTSLRGTWAAGVTLIALLVVAAVHLWRREGRLRRLDPARYMEAADGNAEAARLIVPGALKAALLLMPVGILALVGLSVLARDELCHGDQANAILCWMESWLFPVLGAIIAALTVAAGALSRLVLQGIYVAGDVIIYLNDFDWRRTPEGPPSRTFAELALPGLTRLRRERRTGYHFRSRIRNRLAHLVEDLIATEEPDRVDFVCHSQGTVITLDMLRARAPAWAAEDRAGRAPRRITLITMGSPWRHLYHRYFPKAFPDLSGPPEGVDRWTNIFRVDDFIGTHVRAQSGDETAVNRGGHTNYWRDAEVRGRLKRLLGDGA